MCGIFAITNNKNAPHFTFLGLFALQHRGQESAGIAVENANGIIYYTGMGLVSEVFSNNVLENLKGENAIGHVRYSTAGSSDIINAQPLFFNSSFGQMAIAHNGNLTNAKKLWRWLQHQGAIFQSASDSEIIAHLISKYPAGNIETSLAKNLRKLQGAFSFVFLFKGRVIAARDPFGFRPLLLGKVGKSYIFASESCAIEAVGGKPLRELAPGEMAVVSGGKIRFRMFSRKRRERKSIFEQVYFARPDTVVSQRTVHSTRCEIGELLAGENPDLKADIVAGVPDSGTAYALGFSRRSGIALQNVFMRNRYTGRSFIQPNQKMRDFTARLKLAPIKDVIKRKTIILIDDSLVRGTTSRKIISSLKKAGAKKVFMLIASPPVISPCLWGIDTPTKKELIAAKLSIAKIKNFIGADSLRYLTLKNLVRACANGLRTGFCDACFTGNSALSNK